MRYGVRAAIAVDTCINACLPYGRLDMTLSTRAWLVTHKDWPHACRRCWVALYRILNTLVPGHCRRAMKHDKDRAAWLVKYIGGSDESIPS